MRKGKHMTKQIQDDYDILILGTGPAGLQAAIHAARAKASVLVMGREQKSSLYKAHVAGLAATKYAKKQCRAAG